ncbi:FPR2 [Candida oxycetoniae]|uniref:peptidylprolyl isomerase n=1 Tax=Candida oxycetoniae TaxID=497107 RepID=A0AAI9WZB5_9ASCO|nr:FPR2 [Candida oxycetoniae]KAI3406023.1 FPR2 [Candida oxycetoniae]
MRLSSVAIALSVFIVPAFSASPSPDELKIDILKAVKCTRKTQPGDSISVHYKGTFEDGEKFDSSWDRGTPLTFKVGQGQVIRCWDEGLLEMCIGEKRKLWCHSNVAYGEHGIGPIPGGAALIFETELVDIAGVEKEEEQKEEEEEEEKEQEEEEKEQEEEEQKEEEQKEEEQKEEEHKEEEVVVEKDEL